MQLVKPKVNLVASKLLLCSKRTAILAEKACFISPMDMERIQKNEPIIIRYLYFQNKIIWSKMCRLGQ